MTNSEAHERRRRRPRTVTVLAITTAIAAIAVLAAYLGGYERPVDGIEVEGGVPVRATEPVGLGFTLPVIVLLSLLAVGLWLMRRWAVVATAVLLGIGVLAAVASLLFEADEAADVVVLLIFGVPLAVALLALLRASRTDAR